MRPLLCPFCSNPRLPPCFSFLHFYSFVHSFPFCTHSLLKIRPPLFFIPDGNWFCPACEHKTLCDKLGEKLKALDQNLKKMESEQSRKKRIEYNSISLSNILPDSEEEEGEDVGKDGEQLAKGQTATTTRKKKRRRRPRDSDSEGESETETDEDSEEEEEEGEEEVDEGEKKKKKRGQRQQKEMKTKKKKRRNRDDDDDGESGSGSSADDDDGDDADDSEAERAKQKLKKLSGQRSKRRRQQINYKFNDYDELLDDAIEEGTEWVWEDEEGNPIERPRDLGNYRRDQGKSCRKFFKKVKIILEIHEEYLLCNL